MTPTKQSWAQRARASNWVFVAEIVVVVITVIGSGIAAAGLWVQVQINRATLAEINETTRAEIEAAREFRENVEGIAAKTLEALEKAALDRESEILSRNWTLLTTPAPGNSGKVEAMEYLASKQQPLEGIDLSCETMGGVETNAQGEAVCARPPYLRSLDLSEATHGWKVSLKYADLSGAILESANLSGARLLEADLNDAILLDANLSDAILWDANLSGARLSGANLSDANLWDANLSGASLWGTDLSSADLRDADLSGASMFNTDLSDADLEGADLSDAYLQLANLSGANLTDTELIGADFTDAWAWADTPPLNLSVEIDLCVYENSLERFTTECPDPCIAPSD